MNPAPDLWQHGDPYERYVGRWSRRVAPLFLDWLDQPAGLRWLDVGCGTGALAEAIDACCSPAALIGVDPSEGFLAAARGRLGARASLLVGEAGSLPLPDASVDTVVSGLVLNFVPDAASALDEMARVTRDEGTTAAYVWDYAERMDLMRFFWDAAAELDPAAVRLDEGSRFPLCDPSALAELFEAGAYTEVATTAIEVPTVFADFDDYWMPFLGGQGPAPAYALSLDAAARDALRARLRERLPFARDGSIALTARAWAVRGVRTARPGR